MARFRVFFAGQVAPEWLVWSDPTGAVTFGGLCLVWPWRGVYRVWRLHGPFALHVRGPATWSGLTPSGERRGLNLVPPFHNLRLRWRIRRAARMMRGGVAMASVPSQKDRLRNARFAGLLYAFAATAVALNDWIAAACLLVIGCAFDLASSRGIPNG